MRRKPGVLLPLEVAILRAGVELRGGVVEEFHGYQIASEIRDRDQARMLTSHGTLYKALDRMRRAGLLADRWEDPLAAAAAGRPLRRLYHVTALGQSELSRALAGGHDAAAPLAPGWQPS